MLITPLKKVPHHVQTAQNRILTKRLQPAHGDHVVGRERAAGDAGGRRPGQVRNQLIQDVHGIQGRIHAQVTHFVET